MIVGRPVSKFLSLHKNLNPFKTQWHLYVPRALKIKTQRFAHTASVPCIIIVMNSVSYLNVFLTVHHELTIH